MFNIFQRITLTGTVHMAVSKSTSDLRVKRGSLERNKNQQREFDSQSG